MKNILPNLIKANIYVIKILFKNTPIFILFFILINILISIIPAVNIMLSKNIIDALIGIYDGNMNELIWKDIILLFTLTILNSLFNNIVLTMADFIKAKNDKYLTTITLDKFSKIEIQHLENKSSLDAIEAVMNSQFSISRSFVSSIEIIKSIVSFLSLILIIFTYYPLIALFYLITTIPSLIVQNIQSSKINQWSIDSIPETRQKGYYYQLLTNAYYAKDLKLYNLSTPFKNKFNELWNRIIYERELLFKKGFKVLNVTTIINAVGYIGLYVYLIYKTYIGELSIGGLSAFTVAVFSISNNFNDILSSIMMYQNIFVSRILLVMDFFNWKEEDYLNSENIQTEKFDITFDKVTFTYPNTTNVILKDLSFTIKDGEKIALVGINGAGKSTIVKLLLRMYEPDEGQILINGVNIQNYDINSYRKYFSACFQDITNYSLTLAENVALSDIKNINNKSKIINAINASGLNNIQDKCEKGLETPLTRSFEEDGVELSGGQWQKISIARAFFRNAPFIILDEPSSALDPKAEAQIFNSFSDLCGEKSGILISHRLSNIMMVDRIIFIESGCVRESGIHSELIKQNGIYAKMYNLQAEKYSNEINK